MTVTLEEIGRAFLADEAYLNQQRETAVRRRNTQPLFQATIERFLHGDASLEKFCGELKPLTHETAAIWFAQGRFMMELSKLNKNHIDPTNAIEGSVRYFLSGLNTLNMGQRIEELYRFLLSERERLRRVGKPSNAAVAPGNSALLISLFTAWLDPAGEPTIYNRHVREGLALLENAHLLPGHVELRVLNNVVAVETAADHVAFQRALRALLNFAPSLKITPFWSEYFLHWVMEHLHALIEPESLPVKDIDASNLLEQVSVEPEAAAQSPGGYTLKHTSGPDGDELHLEHKPLQPTPEPLLTHLIKQVRRSILVDEHVVRRIYHALLAGHVILTGPPGTGKTELARLIPETLWQSPLDPTHAQDQEAADVDSIGELTTSTAYTTRLVTATDDWSVRTLISGITPQLTNGSVTYKIQHGHLTAAITKNWALPDDNPGMNVQSLKRRPVTSSSGIVRGTPQQFRGLWLVIDEFNRAPIDLALGDALTALGGHDVLRVAVEGGSAELPIPQDFRIIGTLNSFDRSYLNQISEALKRRFSFVEVLPPGRDERVAEQGIVLYKALKKISHLSSAISVEGETISWGDGLSIEFDPSGIYAITWLEEQHPFRAAFDAAWRVFEVIRIYRQLGTAQAISLLRSLLITGLLQNYKTPEEWIEQALDAALCDTIADQLQVLLPDEVETLFLYLSTEPATFPARYNELLASLVDRKQRLYGQLLALNSVRNESGAAYLSDEAVERIAMADQPALEPKLVTELFHLDAPRAHLPQFTRRLRSFKAEHGL